MCWVFFNTEASLLWKMSLKLQSIASILAAVSFRPDEKVKTHILQCPVLLEEKLLADLV